MLRSLYEVPRRGDVVQRAVKDQNVAQTVNVKVVGS